MISKFFLMNVARLAQVQPSGISTVLEVWQVNPILRAPVEIFLNLDCFEIFKSKLKLIYTLIVLLSDTPT